MSVPQVVGRQGLELCGSLTRELDDRRESKQYQLLKDGDNVLIIPGLGFEGVEHEFLILQFLGFDSGLAEECVKKLCRSSKSEPLRHLRQEKAGSSPLDDQESMTAEDYLDPARCASVS